MEKSWNFVGPKVYEPWTALHTAGVQAYPLATNGKGQHNNFNIGQSDLGLT